LSQSCKTNLLIVRRSFAVTVAIVIIVVVIVIAVLLFVLALLFLFLFLLSRVLFLILSRFLICCLMEVGRVSSLRGGMLLAVALRRRLGGAADKFLQLIYFSIGLDQELAIGVAFFDLL
jgi:hypothetical protein